MSTNAVTGYDEKMNQTLKKQPGAFLTLWLRKKFVSIINCYSGLTWINVEQAGPIFFFTWFTQELDYKVKCTALTVLKISSIKILAVEVLILSVVASDLKTKNIKPI